MSATLHVSGKFVLIRDRKSQNYFLVDTGAEVSVYPASVVERRQTSSGTKLVAANGSTIKTYGTKTITLDLVAGTFIWKFVLANVARPLLGGS